MPYLGPQRHSIVQRAGIGPSFPGEEQARSSHEHHERHLQPGREPNPLRLHRRRDRRLRRAEPPVSRGVLELHDAQQSSGGSSSSPVGSSLHFPRDGQHRLSLGPPQHQGRPPALLFSLADSSEAIQKREHLREWLQCGVLARRQADGLRDPRGSPDRRHVAPQHLRRLRQHAQAAVALDFSFHFSYSHAFPRGSTPFSVLWHPKLNQIIAGMHSGEVVCLYDPSFSVRGAVMVEGRTVGEWMGNEA